MINRDYLYIKRFKSLDSFQIEDDSLYLYCNDGEDRSYACANYLIANQEKISVVELLYVDNDEMIVVGTDNRIPLTSQKAIVGMINNYGHKRVYIDVCGMNVRMAAALLLRIHSTDMEMHVVYSEPHNYYPEVFHREGEDHEWAGIIDGIKPLPGFASFADPNEEFVFCVFLGFEGGRFNHLLREIQPLEELITPIVGIPGFKIEYPYNAYWSNRKGLLCTDSSANVRYASANSIVDAYILLNRIKNDNQGKKIVIAPIGTKPHAIASIAFAIQNFDSIEIVFDNPQKKESRSEGIGMILDCNVSLLLSEDPR